MKIEPQKEHHWLQRLVGEWSYEGEVMTGPGKLPEKFSGTASVRSIGGVWILCEGWGEVPGGGQASSIMTLGFDPQKNRYVGTFIASMMTNLWMYEGQLDSARKVLTLDTEGPSFSDDGKMAKYKDVIEIKSDDHRVLTSNMLDDDGKWHAYMTAPYRRKK